MRKDMRFAWAAGGLLVAVMAVYLLVAGFSGRNKNSQPVELVTNVSPESSSQPQSTPAPQAPAAADHAAQPAAAPVAAAEPKAKSADVWGALLTTGRPPAGMLLTETPQASDAQSNEAPVTPVAMTASTVQSSDVADTDGVEAADVATPVAAPAGPAATTPANAPRPSTLSGKHTVQAGETFSTIAAETYGNAAYWGHIARANPNVDPRHLKVGMVLVLPDPGQVTAAAHPAAKPASAQSVDPAKQYRVQANDSLYKISMKLYHSPQYVDKIYELNKQTIGPNPAHLKLNMILQLPEPPAQGR